MTTLYIYMSIAITFISFVIGYGLGARQRTKTIDTPKPFTPNTKKHAPIEITKPTVVIDKATNTRTAIHSPARKRATALKDMEDNIF